MVPAGAKLRSQLLGPKLPLRDQGWQELDFLLLGSGSAQLKRMNRYLRADTDACRPRLPKRPLREMWQRCRRSAPAVAARHGVAAPRVDVFLPMHQQLLDNSDLVASFRRFRDGCIRSRIVKSLRTYFGLPTIYRNTIESHPASRFVRCPQEAA